jgi:hypothetical protein
MEEFNRWLEELDTKERDEILRIMKLEVIEAVPALIKYLKSEISTIRGAAASGLINLGDSVLNLLISNLKDENEYVRGKLLIILCQFDEKVPFQPIIACLKDEKYWIREVCAQILDSLAKQRPRELVRLLIHQVISEVPTLKIDLPELGSSYVDYMLRLIRGECREYDLGDELQNFFRQLRIIYESSKSGSDEGSRQCKENVIQIMRYFSPPEFWTWDKDFEKFLIPNKQTCWSCEFYVPQTIPLEELHTYLQSKDYQDFCYDHSLWKPNGIIVTPINEETGQFRPEVLEVNGLHIWGFCRKLHRLVNFAYKSKFYFPRKLVPPIKKKIIWLRTETGTLWFLVVEVDFIMKEQLDKWIEWYDLDRFIRSQHDMNLDIYEMLEASALSFEVIDPEVNPKDIAFGLFELKYPASDTDYEILFKFPRQLWLARWELRPWDFGTDSVFTEYLEQLLKTAKIISRTTY